MITQTALIASIALFLLAAGEQWLSAGNLRVAALYACFALTNTAALWVGQK